MEKVLISEEGKLFLEDKPLGSVEGFRCHFHLSEEGEALAELRCSTREALQHFYQQRMHKCVHAANTEFSISQDGCVRWLGQVVAQLCKGEDFLHPGFIFLHDEDLSTEIKTQVESRIQQFITMHFETLLEPLFKVAHAEALLELTQKIAHKLVEAHGFLQRRFFAKDIKALDQVSRAALRRLGVRFGRFYVYLPALIKPAPAAALTLLWALQHDKLRALDLAPVVSYLAAGRTSFPLEENIDRRLYSLSGYHCLETYALRIDILERLADMIHAALYWKGAKESAPEGHFDSTYFFVPAAMLSILGVTSQAMEAILKSLGYRPYALEKKFFEEKRVVPPAKDAPAEEEAHAPSQMLQEDSQALRAPEPQNAHSGAEEERQRLQKQEDVVEQEKSCVEEPIKEAGEGRISILSAQAEPQPLTDEALLNDAAYIVLWKYEKQTPISSVIKKKRQAGARAESDLPASRKKQKGFGPKQKHSPKKPQKTERERPSGAAMDPLSPFAVLLDLKEKMNKN